ncbi:unnamed protein product [Closterium sp. NIES-64]|nr:unnamed protein product [Closterium sp. NIES-64]
MRGDEAALFETTQNPPLPFSPPYPPIHRHSTHAFVQAQEATRQPYLRQLKTRPSPSHPPIPPFIATQPMRVCKHRRRRGSPICVDSIPAPPPLSSSRPPSPIHRHSTHVCAGTGGDEAALFAADVFQMYQRFCAKRGWQFEVLDVTEIEKGGYKVRAGVIVAFRRGTHRPTAPTLPPPVSCLPQEASASVSGDGVLGWLKWESGVHREASASVSGEGVFGSLKWESGVHRVQRVPATEKSGRVHTSAATVAVLPQADEVSIAERCRGVQRVHREHRVQRVPATEKAGRVHTSAATVAVLPQADEVSGAEGYRTGGGAELLIRQDDLRIDVYHSGGCGEQSADVLIRQDDLRSASTCIAVADVERGQLWLRCLKAELYWSVDVSIRQEDLRIDTYRSGGCGGQSVDVLIRQEDLRIDTYRSGGCGWRAVGGRANPPGGSAYRHVPQRRVDVSIRQEDLRIDTYRSGGCGGQSVDVLIRQEDLRIDTYRSGGCGGQSVNTTNSAVRITHLPSGLVVAIQDERSQHMNKAKALKVLRARLFDLQRKQAEASRSQLRHGQIGSGDRSERIRTYNFPQGRITDHRVGLTLHSLPQVLQGEGLEAFIEALEAAAEKEAIDGLAKAG